MVLLISIFSDLKEFNFWGLTGKKLDLEKDLKELKGKEAFAQKKLPKVSKAKIAQVRQNTEVIVQQGSPRSNFLELSFELEKLLRTAAGVVIGSSKAGKLDFKELAKILHEKGVFTDSGLEQISLLQTIRDILIHGEERITEEVLENGLDIAFDLYKNLKKWFENSSSR